MRLVLEVFLVMVLEGKPLQPQQVLAPVQSPVGTTTTIPGGTTTISITTTVSGSTTTSASIGTTIPSTSTTTISEPELKADFVKDKTSGPPPFVVQFTDMSSGNIASYLWDFGDNGTSTEKNPTHTYLSEGAYTVSLRVEGNGNVDEEVKYGYVTVKYSSPTTTTVPTGGGCPAIAVMGDGSHDVKTLRSFRNEILPRQPKGNTTPLSTIKMPLNLVIFLRINKS